MSDYPIVMVCMDLRDVQNTCREFAKNNSIHGIERYGIAKCKIISNGKEYWILHKSVYREWCKGRTYYRGGKLMHSDYEVKEQR